MNALPFSFAQRHGVLLAPGPDGELIALVRAGAGLAGLAEAGRVVRRSLRPKLIDAEEFDRRLRARYESGADSALSIAEDLDEDTELGALARELPAPSDLLDSENDAPIIRLLNAVLASAIRTGASDVHLEPGEFNLSVRFRVDGVLRETLKLRRGLSPLVISRAKVMADLDIAEKRLPQDGRISLRIAGRAVDVRVSTLPGIHGERVVLRLLDKQSGRLDLESLGMDAGTLQHMEQLIQRPHGIVLVTGPTGSGKTTTLYAALDRINDSTRNIMTVEDPVEYYLDGVGQTQVNNRVGLTFARGLRAILRQDPDVVMVGEIRDLETAEIAVRASLTGHLVFSTLHTNTAVGAVTRLRDMGLEPFLISSSLQGILAQRLVRRLDPKTCEPYSPGEYECALLETSPDEAPTLYRPGPVATADGGGYRGRTGIYELVRVDDRLRKLIHDGAPEQQLEDEVRKDAPPLRSNGLDKVRKGITSLEEVMRVTSEE
ncbi:MAG: type II secretion system protein GspE [Gammaproteobacteria bacterium]|nr:type II secretion system ATPase GspE [Gammaproteobacteria bacterium]MXW20490.1 type II secretion system protein GspE [Gammaproteobacteria bacterium]MXZ27637.1 type II secretion system protein GspE [Gammaproteobacteria bacterium]MYF57425.1 type II secretion system protein GspE [Gammaproteobacteria bacterium]